MEKSVIVPLVADVSRNVEISQRGTFRLWRNRDRRVSKDKQDESTTNLTNHIVQGVKINGCFELHSMKERQDWL
jgi:PBP1b-binding outer membrane lipoprotein LpoB